MTWSLTNVSVRFGARNALADVTLDAKAGEVIALLGPSGSGKTTLLRVLAATQSTTAGSVRVLGNDTAGLWGRQLRALRRQVGLMLQADNLVDGLRVFHNVAMGQLGQWSTLRGLATLVWPRAADITQVHAALAEVELADRIWDWPRQLSGGERQRVALARLLLQAPQLWLADEPAAGLDPRLRRTLLRRTIELVRASGSAAVISLHDVELLSEGFDRVVGLSEGRVVADTPASGLDSATVSEIYAA